MARKVLKIETNKDVFQQFKYAKTELEAGTHEEALIRLLLRCSENGLLEMVDEETLNRRLQE